ncbi:hypothetical protein Acr_05g0010790 [Actinidia rufa]|uniref:Uncharacterized protein n=1 Tax=Actinidia rufa TaxID=165716 RepID=A0A7J0EM19_9ERIC|nr:hypothetical protein Acr_05g0010790 [Actinidia rufa]
MDSANSSTSFAYAWSFSLAQIGQVEEKKLALRRLRENFWVISILWISAPIVPPTHLGCLLEALELGCASRIRFVVID